LEIAGHLDVLSLGAAAVRIFKRFPIHLCTVPLREVVEMLFDAGRIAHPFIVGVSF
jgi:hypothetical protein